MKWTVLILNIFAIGALSYVCYQQWTELQYYHSTLATADAALTQAQDVVPAPAPKAEPAPAAEEPAAEPAEAAPAEEAAPSTDDEPVEIDEE